MEQKKNCHCDEHSEEARLPDGQAIPIHEKKIAALCSQ